MLIIYNKFIPFKGFNTLNLFGVFFIRKDMKDYVEARKPVILNHERIHTAQMVELGFVLFYVIYFFEWLFRLIGNSGKHEAYNMISFEKEATEHERDMRYLINRKHYAQWRKPNTK